MLRLTTKVTVSPASSARSSSAAARIALDRARVGAREHRRQLLDRQRLARPRALGRRAHEVGLDRERRLGAARAAPRDEGPVLDLDDVQHVLLDPLRVEVLAVDAQPLGQRDAVLRQALAHLMRRRERVLGRDVVAVGAQPAQVGRARGDQLRPVLGEVRRHLDADAGQQLARDADQLDQVLQRHRRSPTPARRRWRRRRAAPCARTARPRRSRSPPAPRRSTSGAGRSSGG